MPASSCTSLSSLIALLLLHWPAPALARFDPAAALKRSGLPPQRLVVVGWSKDGERLVVIKTNRIKGYKKSYLRGFASLLLVGAEDGKVQSAHDDVCLWVAPLLKGARIAKCKVRGELKKVLKKGRFVATTSQLPQAAVKAERNDLVLALGERKLPLGSKRDLLREDSPPDCFDKLRWRVRVVSSPAAGSKKMAVVLWCDKSVKGCRYTKSALGVEGVHLKLVAPGEDDR
jgi:hypothetical protein